MSSKRSRADHQPEHKDAEADDTQPQDEPQHKHKTQRIGNRAQSTAANNGGTTAADSDAAAAAAPSMMDTAAAAAATAAIASICEPTSSVVSARGASVSPVAASAAAAASASAPAASAAPSPGFVFDESSRLAALHSYAIMHTPPESQFDELVKLAADICQCPVTLISLVDEQSQWFKSKRGLDSDRTPRSVAFCDKAIRNPSELLQVEDALLDPRFAQNALVVGPPHIRFYCGAPLIDTESGQALGTMCAIDFKPRQLNDLQKISLKLLSRQVMAAFESRRRILKLQSALQQLEETRNALRASKEQAEQAVVLAEQANHAKSEFLANMSHEIRTPLNGVLGTASLLAETTRLDLEQKDYVRVIQSSGEHLLIVLNDILDFSKFESGKLEIDAGRVDLQSMLEQAIELSFKPKPHLELVYEIGSDVPAAILGDVTRLRQIAANLISNASKFTSEGQIVIRVERMSAQEIMQQQQAQMQVASLNYSAAQQSSAAAGAVPADSPGSPARDCTASVPSVASTDSPLGSPPVLGSVVPAVSSNLLAPTAVSPIQLAQITSASDPTVAAPVAASSDDVSAASAASAPSAPLLSPPSVGFSPFVAPLIPPVVHEAFQSSDEPESMMLVLSVSDTGIGIDPGKINKLFSAFTQLDVSITREYGGTGLGLAISARLAQLMGGTMWVKSEVGKGSTFFCSIRTQAWQGRCNSGSSSPSHANSPLPSAHTPTPPTAPAAAAVPQAPQRSPLWLTSSHTHSNSMSDSVSSESSVPPRLQMRHQSTVSRSRELSPSTLHRDRSGSDKFAVFDAEVSAVTSQPETATQRIAYSFPAFAYAAASPALVVHTQQRTHAVVIESNAFLLRSLSSQLQRWGFVPHSFSSIAAAEELWGDSDVRKRIAVIIVSHEKALAEDAEGSDAYALIDRVRKMDVKPLALDATDAACAIEVDEAPPSAATTASSASSASSPSSAAAAAPTLTTAVAASISTPLVYTIPAIVLLPSKLMDEGNPQTPPVTDVNQFCTTLRKPVLHSKLQSLLNKSFQIALFGAQYAAQNYSPTLTPLQLPQVHRSNTGSSSNSPRRVRSPLPQCALPGSVKSDPSQGTLVYTHRPAQPSSRAKPTIDAALMRSDLEGDVSPDPSLTSSRLLPRFPLSGDSAAAAAAGVARPTTALDVAVASNAGRFGAASSAASAASASAASASTAAVPPATSFTASSRKPLAVVSSKHLRVLCVEDNVINMKLVVKMLHTLGFTSVAQAWNGQEAVDLIVRDGRQFDLVLMDLTMPLLTGPQACKIILAHYAATQPDATPPVCIALTASCMESDKLEAKQSGHSDFMSKPLSLPTLKAKMQQWEKKIARKKQEKDKQMAAKAAAATAAAAADATAPAATSAAAAAPSPAVPMEQS